MCRVRLVNRSCCGVAAIEGVDDMQYLKMAVEHATSHYRIDSSQVFVSGASNGGSLVIRAACELGTSVFAGAAADVGSLEASQAHINNTAPLFRTGARNCDVRCGLHPLVVAGAKHVSNSDSKHFAPYHFMDHDDCFIRPSAGRRAPKTVWPTTTLSTAMGTTTARGTKRNTGAEKATGCSNPRCLCASRQVFLS